MSAASVLLLLFIHTAFANSVTQDLGGTKWTAVGKHPPSSVITQLPHAEVPGCVHTDWLYGKTAKEDDPYYRFNDVDLRNIAESDWKYSTDFPVNSDLLSQTEQWLVFEGLDTFSYVSLNGKLIGPTKNMFLEYRYNVTGLLQQNFNMLVVAFTSAITVAQNFSSFLTYTIPPNCPPDVQHGICHVNLIRKEQCSFSWDWGPAFATQGIWKPVYLSALSDAELLHATATYNATNSSLDFRLKFQVVKLPSIEHRGNVAISIPELGVDKLYSNVTLPKSGHQFSFLSLMLDLNDVKFQRWWPNGYGTPKLYNISVSFNSSFRNETSHANFRFGFRKVELVQEAIPGSQGLSFYFKINDVPIFAKGANWIPADAFHTRITTETFRNLLTSARDAHMNMMRVWGGGVYEDRRLYEIADELGIMLWQDFMFACAMYPADANFLQSVTEEVTHQVARLQHHPSIVIWAANNENEAALATDWYNTTANFETYKKDYVSLYVDTIDSAMRTLDQSRPFLTSSPTNGAESEREGWVAKNPYSVYYGDVHYYNYNDDCLDWTKFSKTRFASEYGFQSWPSFETVEPVTESRDWSLDSDWSNHRQHHADGNKQMTNQISMHFKLPDVGNSTQIFKDTIYLTQVMQALCYKSQTEFYRRSRNELVGGAGHTMGALYWQLNDIWQAPTWSSIEHGGKWKILHYFAQKFFAPVALIAFDDDTTLNVYSASDADQEIKDTLVITIRSWQSPTSYGTFSEQVTIPARQSTSLFQKSTGELLHYGNCPYKELCYISIQLKNSTSVPATYFFPVPFKDISGLKKPVIKVSQLKQLDTSTFQLSLVSSNPALFVWLQAIGIRGRFSDNGFVMPEVTHNVTFYSWQENLSPSALMKSLQVRSLADIYQTSAEPATDDSPNAARTTSWLDDVTSKLIFAIVGVLFIIFAAVQFTCLVLRLNVPSKRQTIKSRRQSNNNYDLSQPKRSVTSMTSSRSGSVVDDLKIDEPMAFLIQSKRGYGHTAKKTEIRFYVI